MKHVSTLLHLFAGKGKVVYFLLSTACLAVGLADDDSNRGLFTAVKQHSSEGVYLELKKGADPNAKIGDGEDAGLSVLITAVRNGSARRDKPEERFMVIKQLLLRGANPNLSVNGGITPLMFAQRLNFGRVEHLLKEFGAREETMTEKHRLALYAKVDAYVMVALCDTLMVYTSGRITNATFADFSELTISDDPIIVAKRGVDVFGNPYFLHPMTDYRVGISEATFRAAGENAAFWRPFPILVGSNTDPTSNGK